jgi:dTDP-4-dehydrorhamnose 3,5-epimerase
VRFVETPLEGLWVIELEALTDDRGWFARTYDAQAFRDHGIDTTVVECNASFNARADTVRGLHYQADPHGESKLVRCVSGAIFDVALDLRPESPTYCRWYGAELSAANGRMLFVPVGFAHGFQTLLAESEVLYQMGHPYVPDAARGVRWDDPAFGIDWPPPASGVRKMSERDATYPDFEP